MFHFCFAYSLLAGWGFLGTRVPGLPGPVRTDGNAIGPPQALTAR